MMYEIFKDTFTGPNAALDAHSPEIGGPWADEFPGLVIDGNLLTGSTKHCKSSAPVGRKVARAIVSLDYNGAEARSYVRVEFSNAAGDYVVWHLNAGGDNYLTVNEETGGGYIHSSLKLESPAAGVHQYGLAVCPGGIIASFRGVQVFNLPRLIPAQSLLDKVSIVSYVAAGLYPKIYRMVVV